MLLTSSLSVTITRFSLHSRIESLLRKSFRMPAVLSCIPATFILWFHNFPSVSRAFSLLLSRLSQRREFFSALCPMLWTLRSDFLQSDRVYGHVWASLRRNSGRSGYRDHLRYCIGNTVCRPLRLHVGGNKAGRLVLFLLSRLSFHRSHHGCMPLSIPCSRTRKTSCRMCFRNVVFPVSGMSVPSFTNTGMTIHGEVYPIIFPPSAYVCQRREI